jgi:endonuclease/exonuclease/phosphatase family metal-dependent hydrolase
VLSWNIHHGEGVDGKLDLDRIAALIREARPHLVALQEVDRGVARTERRDLPGELARLTGMTAVFSNNYAFQGGEYGNAILSRLPVLSWTNRHYAMLRAGEQRGLLEVRVAWEGRSFRFFSTHLDYRPDDTERMEHSRYLRAVLEAQPEYPALVAGDFNTTPSSIVSEYLRGFLGDAWLSGGAGEGASYPSTGGVRRIDYLYVWPIGAMGVQSGRVLASEASDHLPVVFDLGWSVMLGEQ